MTQVTATNTQVAVKYQWNVNSLLIDMSADNRTTTLGRHIDQHIGRQIGQVSTNMSVDISTDTSWSTGTWPICWPTYRSTLGRYVDRYIGWVLVDITTNTLVVGCAKYTWSPSSGLVLGSGPSQDPKMKPKLTLEWYQSSQIIHWIISSSICKLDQINSMCEITHQIVVCN